MSPIPRKKKLPDLNEHPDLDKWKATAQRHVLRLDAENSLALVDANYVHAFKNPLFASAFMEVFAAHLKSRGMNVPPSIQRLLDDNALLHVIEEPDDGTFYFDEDEFDIPPSIRDTASGEMDISDFIWNRRDGLQCRIRIEPPDQVHVEKVASTDESKSSIPCNILGFTKNRG